MADRTGSPCSENEEVGKGLARAGWEGRSSWGLEGRGQELKSLVLGLRLL